MDGTEKYDKFHLERISCAPLEEWKAQSIKSQPTETPNCLDSSMEY